MVVFSLLLASVGCAEVALIGRPTLTPRAVWEKEQITGHVVSVNPTERIVWVRSLEGQEEFIGYGEDTAVIREGRETHVQTLRAGERVAVRLVRGHRDESAAFTDLIIIQRSN